MRVLLVRAGALGDLLLLRRAITGLRDAGHWVSLMAPASPAKALLGPGAVDEVLDWGDPSFLPLFAEGAPVEGDPRLGALAARLAGFSACLAYTENHRLVARLERLIPRVIARAPAPDGVHAAEWLAAPARTLGVDPPPGPPDLAPTDSEQTQAGAFLGDRLAPGFLAIHPGSGSPVKNWPADRFARLSVELGGHAFLLVEGPADAAALAGLGEAATCVRAKHLPLRTLGAVLRRAGLFVGNDSGITHLAAAWGAPTLALFGPTDPAIWSPLGRRVAIVRSPSRAMDDLPLAVVAEAARALQTHERGPATASLKSEERAPRAG